MLFKMCNFEFEEYWVDTNSLHMYFCENLDFLNVPRDSGHDVFNNFDILCCDGALAKQAWTHVYLSTLTNLQSHKCSNPLVWCNIGRKVKNWSIFSIHHVAHSVVVW